jgi:acetyl esterase/lipase
MDKPGAKNTNYESDNWKGKMETYNHLTVNNYVIDIVKHPTLRGFGELLLPYDNNSGYYNTILSNIGLLMPYHSYIDPEIIVGALNHMIDEADSGRTIFYDFYSDDQKRKDPAREYTGLIYFRGRPDAPFAIVCPGGGFSYVGSLHEGFPLALEISKKGYNVFVIRYRIGSEQKATEDLAAAISFIFRKKEILNVETKDYALWGGSAGARMVGNIALRSVSAYGGGNIPRPAVAVIAYTGQTSWSKDFSPSFITVASNDRIVNVNTVDKRVENLRKAGVEVEYCRYQSAGHGFGTGKGTDADGWIDLAVRFWEKYLLK